MGSSPRPSRRAHGQHRQRAILDRMYSSCAAARRLSNVVVLVMLPVAMIAPPPFAGIPRPTSSLADRRSAARVDTQLQHPSVDSSMGVWNGCCAGPRSARGDAPAVALAQGRGDDGETITRKSGCFAAQAAHVNAVELLDVHPRGAPLRVPLPRSERHEVA